MDDNGTSLGRMTAAVMGMSIVILCAFLLFSFFITSAQNLRDTDTERRQEQKDSISVTDRFTI